MNEKNVGSVVNPHAIARVSVEKLFGQFTYQLPTKDADQPDLSNLFILYGDNGSGKTTLLKLVFHLLSPEPARGHKSWVAKVRFRRLAIDLADGTTIEAFRSGKNLIGPFRAAIIKDSETIDSFDFPGGQDGNEEEKAQLVRFLNRLEKLDLALHFLPDNRRILGPNADEQRRSRTKWTRTVAGEIFMSQFQTEEEDVPETELALRNAVARAHHWFNQQAFQGSDLGQQNVNSIYADIVTHIASSSATEASETRAKIENLAESLQLLSARSGAYSRFGLTTELPVEKLVNSLENAPPDRQTIIYNVVKPYVQSIQARLKALEGIHNLVETFIGNINRFFGPRKRVTFNLRHGLQIWDKGREALDLEMLSSGEKQLLLLLCNTLASRDRATIFIIDEPEISLNVKWQRQLVQALLDCIKGSSVQLIFATHSIELLARHKSHVVKLIDLNEMEAKEGLPEEDEDGERRKTHARRTESQV